MVAVLYLKVVLELATARYISASFSTPNEVDCSRLCILNDTCYRYWSSVTKERSPWFGHTGIISMSPDKGKFCLDHPGYIFEGPGFCLKYVTTKKIWEKARDTCQADGASLVKIDSKLKNTFLKTAYGAINTFWLGGSDAPHEGRWEWTDGTPVKGFVDWNGDEPDGFILQNCMSMRYDGWYSGRCSHTPKPFLCEIVAE